MCLIGKTELYQYHPGIHLCADVHMYSHKEERRPFVHRV